MEEQGAKDNDNSVSEIKEQTEEQKSLIEFDQQHFDQKQILVTKSTLQVIQDHGSEISKQSQNFMSEEENQMEIVQTKDSINQQMGPEQDKLQENLIQNTLIAELQPNQITSKVTANEVFIFEKQDQPSINELTEKSIPTQPEQVQDFEQVNASQDVPKSQSPADYFDNQLQDQEPQKKLSRQSSQQVSSQNSQPKLIESQFDEQPFKTVEEQSSLDVSLPQQEEHTNKKMQEEVSAPQIEFIVNPITQIDTEEKHQEFDDPIETTQHIQKPEPISNEIVLDSQHVQQNASSSYDDRWEEMFPSEIRPNQNVEESEPVKHLSFGNDLNLQLSQVLAQETPVQDVDQNLLAGFPRDSKSDQIHIPALTDHLSTEEIKPSDVPIEPTINDILQQSLKEISDSARVSISSQKPFSDQVMEMIDQNERDMKIDSVCQLQKQGSSKNSSMTELVQRAVDEQKVEEKIDPEMQKPKDTIKSQLQNIKQGFMKFMNRKKSDDDESFEKLDKKENENILPSKVVGQLGEFFKKVQENVKQQNVSETLKNFAIGNVVSEGLQSIEDKIQDKLPNQMIQPIKDQLTRELVKQITESVQIVKEDSGKNDIQEPSLMGNFFSMVKEKAEAKLQQSGIIDYLSPSKHPSNNLSLSPIQEEGPEDLSPQKFESQSLTNNVNYVDRMVAVLEKLDKEYEEELKSKPKQSIPRRQNSTKAALQANNNQPLKRKTTKESNSSSKRQSTDKQGQPTKPTLSPNKQSQTAKTEKPQEQSKQSKIVTPNPVTPKGKTKTPQEPKPQIKNVKTSYIFPAEVVDAPEIIFFLPSWFQFTDKQKTK